MQERLARHFAPAEAIVLGTRLQPYTLWHWRTLAVLGSPLVLDTQEGATLQDLALGVRVCSLAPHTDIFKALKLGWIGRIRMAIACGTCFPEDEYDRFLEYVDHFCSGPRPRPRSEAHAGASRVKVHPTIYLAAGLISMGFTEREAWAQTPGLARWYIAGASEFHGDEVSIISEAMIADAIKEGYTEEDFA